MLIKIETKRLFLREIDYNDVAVLSKGLGDFEIAQFLEDQKFPYTIDDAKEFVEWYNEERKKEPVEIYDFGIQPKNMKDIIGEVGLNPVNWREKSAGLFYWLLEEYRSRGYATEAVKRLVNFSFSDLRLNRLEISASVKNISSIRLAERLNFKSTNKTERYKGANEIIHDALIFELLRD